MGPLPPFLDPFKEVGNIKKIVKELNLKTKKKVSFDMEVVSSLPPVTEEDRNTKKVKIRDGEVLDRMNENVEDLEVVGMEGVDSGTE